MHDYDVDEVLRQMPIPSRGPKVTKLRLSLSQGLTPDVCWPWLGRRHRNGYGMSYRPKEDAATTAHRIVWELFNGPAPDGSHVDHLCHDPRYCEPGMGCPHRACINPWHLNATSARANLLRGGGISAANAAKAECLRGHPFDEFNTYWTSLGQRSCRACKAIRREQKTGV